MEVPPLPWRELECPKRVGMMTYIKKMPASKAHYRALEMAKAALEKNGIEIVEIDINDIFEDIMVTSMAAFLKND